MRLRLTYAATLTAVLGTALPASAAESLTTHEARVYLGSGPHTPLPHIGQADAPANRARHGMRRHGRLNDESRLGLGGPYSERSNLRARPLSAAPAETSRAGLWRAQHRPPLTLRAVSSEATEAWPDKGRRPRRGR
jgi:hypothetical protein